MTESRNREVATLGGGCFWCIQAVLKNVEGVLGVTSGYAGGEVPQPSYEQVCTGETGHIEVVQVEFDPARISYRDLLGVFFRAHDPTTKDRQGADVGPQYRSVVFFHSPVQQRVASEVMKEVENQLGKPVVTELRPAPEFYRAEEYHQDYFEKNPYAGYCQAVIRPKLAGLGFR